MLVFDKNETDRTGCRGTGRAIPWVNDNSRYGRESGNIGGTTIPNSKTSEERADTNFYINDCSEECDIEKNIEDCCLKCDDDWEDGVLGAKYHRDEFADTVKRIFGDIQKILIIKNTNYDSSFDKIRREYGPTSFLIRIKDKLHRYQSLATSDSMDCDDERIEDTLKDIIGYTMLELIFREKTFID